MEATKFNNQNQTSDLLQSLLDYYCSGMVGVIPWLQDEIMSKKEWSKVLKINRNTLTRWERGIIHQKAPLKSYFYKDRQGKPGYDAYQRFITLVIYVLKCGAQPRTNKEVLEYFSEKKEQKYVWAWLSKDNFTKYMEMQNNEQR